MKQSDGGNRRRVLPKTMLCQGEGKMGDSDAVIVQRSKFGRVGHGFVQPIGDYQLAYLVEPEEHNCVVKIGYFYCEAQITRVYGLEDFAHQRRIVLSQIADLPR